MMQDRGKFNMFAFFALTVFTMVDKYLADSMECSLVNKVQRAKLGMTKPW